MLTPPPSVMNEPDSPQQRGTPPYTSALDYHLQTPRRRAPSGHRPKSYHTHNINCCCCCCLITLYWWLGMECTSSLVAASHLQNTHTHTHNRILEKYPITQKTNYSKIVSILLFQYLASAFSFRIVWGADYKPIQILSEVILLFFWPGYIPIT